MESSGTGNFKSNEKEELKKIKEENNKKKDFPLKVSLEIKCQNNEEIK